MCIIKPVVESLLSAAAKMCNSYWCLGVVTCFLLSSYALPQEQDISSQPKNPFDAGAVSSCEVPETRYCADYVTYQVPSSIAWLAVIKDNKISNTIEPMEDDLSDSQCNIEILKETWCKKEFPRCSDSVESNQVLFEAPENCEERLRSSNCVQADSIIKRGFCQSSQSTLHSGSCRTLSSHDQVGELQQCSALGEDVQVSDWMFHYISRVDMELRSGVLVRQTQECWQLYRNFLCGAVGECVGERVRMINTQEMCQAILNCYSDEIAVAITDILSCESWPSQSLRTTSSPTHSTSPASIQWIQPNVRTADFANSVLLLQATSHVIICVALLAIIFV